MEEYQKIIAKLESLGVIHQFLDNIELLMDEGLTLAEAYETTLRTPYEGIMLVAFPWDGTKEGEDFWLNIHLEILNLYNQKQLNYETN